MPWRIVAGPYCRNIWGSAACTVGVSNAPSTASSTCMVAMAAILKPAAAKTMALASTSVAEMASSATMIVRRLTRSASTPPNGESRMVGTMEMASTEANTVAEPVSSSTHIDMAKRSIILPNSEIPWPATNSTKSRERGGRWGLLSFLRCIAVFIVSLSLAPLSEGSCRRRRLRGVCRTSSCLWRSFR